MQQGTCKFDMTKCNWNVVKSDNSQMCEVKKDKISSCAGWNQSCP
jgi:hypothetical protein